MTDASAPEIVVGCDGSASSHSAIRWAAHEAGMRNVALRLVHVGAAPAVINVMRPVPVEFEEWQDQQARQVLAEATALVAEIGTAIGIAWALSKFGLTDTVSYRWPRTARSAFSSSRKS